MFHTNAQGYREDFSFYRSNHIPVVTTDLLTDAWAGGINGVRFSSIDLNNDGIEDLFAFEKHGNRILPFIYEDGRYRYAPEYIQHFPDLHDWAILKDYNHDGKPDIFTYGLAGITLYKNTSLNNTLSFTKVTDQLTAFYYNGYVNIYASPDDYLVVDDVDGDGAIDILNFWVLGKYVHYLRNYSTDPEVLDFRLESECWGHFSEATDNNAITLYSDCSNKSFDDEQTRHTGSSMLLVDLDKNSLPDLLLGDIDSPNLILLRNHGTVGEARMTEQDTAFPTGAPIHLYSMPAPSSITLPGGASPVLIASPSDPSLTKSQDLNSVWLYTFDSLLNQYTLSNTAFLQENMLDVGSGSLPILFDWNQDGLLDLFITNYGAFDSARTVNGFLTSYFSSSIHYFQNIGSATQPRFKQMDDDFGNLRSYNFQALYPTFGDFDQDGLLDMICGEKEGTLIFVPHARILNGVDSIQTHYKNIDVGKYSTPQYFDLDRDGRKDLIIGNQRGRLSYYRNSSSYDGVDFELITDTLGGVDVRNYEQSYFGYSVPYLYRDAQHGTVLICGSENGKLHYYNNLDDNLNGMFEEGVLWESADETCDYCARPYHDGKRTGAAIADLDGDNLPELIVGNYAGGVTLLKGRTPVLHGVSVSQRETESWRVYPNPATKYIQIQGSESVHSATLYTPMGIPVLHTNQTRIPVAHLPRGLYIVKINNLWSQKVVIQ